MPQVIFCAFLCECKEFKCRRHLYVLNKQGISSNWSDIKRNPIFSLNKIEIPALVLYSETLGTKVMYINNPETDSLHYQLINGALIKEGKGLSVVSIPCNAYKDQVDFVIDACLCMSEGTPLNYIYSRHKASYLLTA